MPFDTLVAEMALDRASSELRKLSETDSASLPRRAVILVLQMLGLDAGEASALAGKLSDAAPPARPLLTGCGNRRSYWPVFARHGLQLLY